MASFVKKKDPGESDVSTSSNMSLHSDFSNDEGGDDDPWVINRSSKEAVTISGKLGQIHVIIANPSDAVQIGSNNIMYTNNKSSKKPRKTVVKVSKRLINDDDMDQLARSLGHDWRPLGLKLGFLRGELDAFEYDHQMAGLHTIIYKMLLAWQERQGPDAWIKVMVQQLINIKRSDIAKMLI